MWWTRKYFKIIFIKPHPCYYVHIGNNSRNWETACQLTCNSEKCKFKQKLLIKSMQQLVVVNDISLSQVKTKIDLVVFTSKTISTNVSTLSWLSSCNNIGVTFLLWKSQ